MDSTRSSSNRRHQHYSQSDGLLHDDPDYVRELLPHHREQLEVESGIDPGVIEERGYYSVTDGEKHLQHFSPKQRELVPCLYIPGWDIHGDPGTPQIRPDKPRKQKYETQARARVRLDVHPWNRSKLKDASITLYITEGVKKADKGTSQGLCVISITGVWCWQRKNGDGKSEPLADWDAIHLDGRLCRIAFDSDMMKKPQVRAALAALRQFLESRGAIVEVIYFEETFPDGEKVGLDDYFVGGGTAEGLGELTIAPEPEKAKKSKQAEKVSGSGAGAYGDDERPYQWNTYGIGRRLVDRYIGNIYYCHAHKCWYVWDGRYWVPDDDGKMQRLAAETISTMYAELAKVDDSDRREFFRHIANSQSTVQRGLAIESASNDERVVISPEKLDADRWLLNVENGTLDLRTGERREHRREDLITKMAPARWDPKARDEVWDKFMSEAVASHPELEAYLQTGTYITLSGDTSDKEVIFLHGPPDGGKSTFLTAIRSTLGSYAVNMAFETLLKRKYAGATRSDIARLEGYRMVYSIETEASDQLDAGLLKWLSGGGDEVTARSLYKNERTFIPQFTLWLAANEMPKMKVEDAAAWERVKMVGFLHVPKKLDRSIREHLKTSKKARAAVLAWAMRGRERWLRDGGLVAPASVVEDTAATRAAMNPLRDWAEECCYPVPTAGVWTSTDRLRKSYERWCRSRAPLRPISHPNFTAALRGLGSRPERGYEGDVQLRGWAGIALTKTEASSVAASEEDPFGEEEPS